MALLAALAIAATGCANSVAGTPVAGPVSNEPLTAKQVFGDVTTVDYCSLVNAEALPDELGSVIDNGVPTFDYCFLAIRMKGAHIEGQVGYLEDKATIGKIDRTEDRQRKPPRGLKVQRGEESNDACERFLQFADDVWLTVTADNYHDQDATEGDWCPLADAMLDMIIERVGTVTVRHLPFEPKSVGILNACDLVKPDAVAAKLGLPKVDELRYPSGHDCAWPGAGPSSPSARVTFDLRPVDGDGAKDESIAGRASKVVPNEAASDSDFSVCLVETEHIKSTVFRTEELVDVEVALPGKGKDACAPGRELAKEVWAKLPTP